MRSHILVVIPSSKRKKNGRRGFRFGAAELQERLDRVENVPQDCRIDTGNAINADQFNVFETRVCSIWRLMMGK